MTNWMTASGIALIAGGLATLIGFRKMLWPGRGATKRRPARTPAIEAAARSARTPATEAARSPRRIRTIQVARPGRTRAIELAPRPGRTGTIEAARRPGRTEAIDADRGSELPPADGRPTVLLPAQAGAPDISGAHLASATPAQASSGNRRIRRRGRREATLQRDKHEHAGLASIGLADDEPLEDDLQQYDERPEDALRDDQCDERPEDALVNDQYDERPEDALEEDQYDERQEQENGLGEEPDVQESHVDSFDYGRSDPPTGDYWMPVPESAYAELDSAGYGWPVRRDRDPAVESQPTAVVPVWPPARPFDRIELPRTWSEGAGPNLRALREVPGRRWSDANRNGGRRRQVNEDVAVRHWDQLDRDGRDGWRRNSGPEDQPDAASRPRPRPRPNPSAEARSTVYVSKHAAE